jgi:hypothetical protein
MVIVFSTLPQPAHNKYVPTVTEIRVSAFQIMYSPSVKWERLVCFVPCVMGK